MFKVNNNNTRTTSMTYFTPFSSVSFIDFEQVNVSWVITVISDLISKSSLHFLNSLSHYQYVRCSWKHFPKIY